MVYYPIFLDLTSLNCLIVGAGAVGLRKLKDLQAAKARQIIVVDPILPENWGELSNPDTLASPDTLANPDALDNLEPLDFLHKQKNGLDSCIFKKKSFELEDLASMSLVFAATNNFAVNDFIAQACQQRQILCNVITNPKACSFIVPSQLGGKNILVALSTGGKSPALTKKLRQELESRLLEYEFLAELLGRLRPYLLDLQLGTEHNAQTLRKLAYSKELLAGLANKDEPRCLAELNRLVPGLRLKFGELLHGLV